MNRTHAWRILAGDDKFPYRACLMVGTVRQQPLFDVRRRAIHTSSNTLTYKSMTGSFTRPQHVRRQEGNGLVVVYLL